MVLLPLVLAALFMGGLHSADYSGPHFAQRSIVSDAHKGD